MEWRFIFENENHVIALLLHNNVEIAEARYNTGQSRYAGKTVVCDFSSMTGKWFATPSKDDFERLLGEILGGRECNG